MGGGVVVVGRGVVVTFSVVLGLVVISGVVLGSFLVEDVVVIFNSGI